MKTRNRIPKSKPRTFLVAMLIITMLLLGCTAKSSGNLLTQEYSEPLNGATSATLDIHTGTGNLTIDRLTGGEPLLAGGTLEYLEGQGVPDRTVVTFNGLSTLTLKARGKPQTGFRLPWEACNGETSWQLHLNPGLPTDITARSDGGNLQLNLTGMAITRVNADTGGGNTEVFLPDHTANLSVTAKTGAGNVTVEMGSGITGSHIVNASSGAGDVVVRLPGGIAARIHLTSGMGKVNIDTSFSKIDDQTYQSPNYNSAANRVEITASSGAGNVTVDIRD